MIAAAVASVRFLITLRVFDRTTVFYSILNQMYSVFSLSFRMLRRSVADFAWIQLQVCILEILCSSLIDVFFVDKPIVQNPGAANFFFDGTKKVLHYDRASLQVFLWWRLAFEKWSAARNSRQVHFENVFRKRSDCVRVIGFHCETPCWRGRGPSPLFSNRATSRSITLAPQFSGNNIWNYNILVLLFWCDFWGHGNDVLSFSLERTRIWALQPGVIHVMVYIIN
jgi:hypothetical protein